MSSHSTRGETTTDNSATPTDGRPKYWMFAVYIVVVAAGGILLLVGISVGIGGSVNTRIDRLRQQGEPTSMADLRTRYLAVPPEENVAAALDALAPRLNELHTTIEPLLIARFEVQLDWSAEQLEVADKTFAENETLLNELRAALARPSYAPLLDSQTRQSQLSQTQASAEQARLAARILRLEADYRLQQGDRQAALEIGLDLMRFGNQLQAAPKFTGYLKSVAVRMIGADLVNQVLQAEIATEGPLDNALDAILEERLEGLVAEENITDGFLEAVATERAYMIDQTRESGGMAMSRMLTMMFDEIDKTIAEVKSDGLAPPPMAAANPNQPMSGVMLSSRRAAVRWLIAGRALRMLHALSKQPELPATGDLSQFAPDEQAIGDPYRTSRPLQNRRENGGWTIWSVGPDGVDQQAAGDDVVFRRSTAASTSEPDSNAEDDSPSAPE